MQQGADYMHWFKPARDADDDCATMEEWCYLLQAAGSKMVVRVFLSCVRRNIVPLRRRILTLVLVLAHVCRRRSA